MHHIGEGAPDRLDARRSFRQRAVDDAVAGQDSAKEHFGDDLDNAGAANSGDADPGDRFGKARLVRPKIAADHLESRLQSLPIDAHALDRAGRSALAAGNLRALEGRAGRRGTGEQPILVAKDKFGVGADIDEKGQFVAQIGPFGKHDAGGVRADMPGDARQAIDEGAGRDGEAQLRARASNAASSASANGAPPSSVGSRPRNK